MQLIDTLKAWIIEQVQMFVVGLHRTLLQSLIGASFAAARYFTRLRKQLRYIFASFF